ncbi:MAG: hypothetical protein ACYDDO_12210 [Acidiferrobacterales bacterium]
MSRLFWLAIAAILTLAVYYPGLSGDFEFDDANNILNNTALQISTLSPAALLKASLSGIAGPLKRPVSMVSFAINFYETGKNPFYFKLTNVILHLLTGLSIFVLTNLLLNVYRGRTKQEFSDRHIAWVAIATSCAWLVHPLNVEAVLYVVQRMTILSGLFTVWALICYVAGRRWLDAGRTSGIFAVVFGFVGFGGLSIFSKENGALIPLFVLVIELTIFRFRLASEQSRRYVPPLLGVFVALPLIVGLIYVVSHYGWLTQGYQIRNFSLYDRLLTEARVLWMYLRLMVLPSNALMGIYHDDIRISHGLLDPASTLSSIIGLLALLGIALYSLKRAPILAFGILWFFAGHSMESTIIPLEITEEHRNYLPLYGILFALVFYLLYPLKFRNNLYARYGLVGIFILLLAVTTALRANEWGSLAGHAAYEVEHHPRSARAAYQLGRIYYMLYSKDKRPEFFTKSRDYFEKTTILNPRDAGGLVGLLQLSYLAHKDPQSAWIRELTTTLRNSSSVIGNLQYLHTLTDCQISAFCRIDNANMMHFYSALIANTHLTPRIRADSLTLKAVYYANKMDNLNPAGKLFMEAVKTDPGDPIRHLNLAQWYIIKKQYDNAHKEIDRAQEVDSYGVAQHAIQAERLLLAQHMKHTAISKNAKPTGRKSGVSQ